MLRPFRRVLVPLFALALVFGATACSDDESPSADDTRNDDVSAAIGGGDQDTEDVEFDFDELTGGSDRPFDVSREDLAKSISGGVQADRWEVEGDTIYLFFDEGTFDSIPAAINCSVALTLQSDEDRVVLVYPDGEVDCNEQS